MERDPTVSFPRRSCLEFRTRTYRSCIFLVLASCALVCSNRASTLRADSVAVAQDLDELRALEATIMRTIEKASPAFCFIEGGSGFLVGDEGHILTNEHVIAGKSEATVYLAAGRSFRAKVLGHDPGGDLALLQIEGDHGVTPLQLGDSSTVEIGQPVIALGDPFLIASANLFLDGAPPDFEPSASFGTVSALHRYSELYFDAIQVDVAVNRGNSGGPLLTLDGKVIGVNGKIETSLGLGINTGVGYAIPSNQIRRFLEPLANANGGIVQHGTIRGLSVGDRAEAHAGLPVLESRGHAARLGFKAGDRLLEIAGYKVPTETRYHGVLGTYPAGSEVSVTLQRKDETLTLSVPLIEPGPARLGIDTTTPGENQSGVRIKKVHPGSPADRGGLKVDDVIVGFNDAEVKSGYDLKKLLQSSSAGEVVRFKIRRASETLEKKVRLGGTGRALR